MYTDTLHLRISGQLARRLADVSAVSGVQRGELVRCWIDEGLARRECARAAVPATAGRVDIEGGVPTGEIVVRAFVRESDGLGDGYFFGEARRLVRATVVLVAGTSIEGLFEDVGGQVRAFVEDAKAGEAVLPVTNAPYEDCAMRALCDSAPPAAGGRKHEGMRAEAVQVLERFMASPAIERRGVLDKLIVPSAGDWR